MAGLQLCWAVAIGRCSSRLQTAVPCTEGLIRQRSPAQDTNVLREGSVQGHSIVHLVLWLQRCLPLPCQRPQIERYHLRMDRLSWYFGSSLTIS